MKSKLTKIFGVMVSLVITITMLMLPAQSAAAPAPGEVDLVLVPSTLTVNPGDVFEVVVRAECGTQSTNGIEVHLDFNPEYLEVQSITQGITLVTVLQAATWNNISGTIDFSAGQLTTPPDYPSGNFTVLTISFVAKTVTATAMTPVTFHTADTRVTNVILDAAIITGTLAGATYTINDVIPPTVQAISPINGATGVSVATAIAVTFDEPMNTSATEGAFSIDPSVAGAFGWSGGGTVLTFTPTADLALDTLYTIGISTAATDTATIANHLAAAFSASFTTQAVLPAPPAVTTLAATGATETSVTLNANLTALGTTTPVDVFFEYGYTSAYGKTTAIQSMGATGAFNAIVTGLMPGMEWHYRAVADGEDTVYGNDMTISTTGYTTKFVFISARDGNDEIYSLTADGQYTARLTANVFREAWPRLTPDFSYVTFTSWRDGNPEVYAMYPDGTIQTRLTNNAAFDGMSDFSWDGSKIVFVSDRDGNNEIYVMNADGTGQTRITSNPASDIMPAFSPDGTKIAFVSNRDGNEELYVMNADGTGQTRLTENAVADVYPSWLNDGTKISFSSQRDGNSEIYVIDADGANPLRLTENDIADEQPFWCPTGNAIVYTSWVAGIPQVIFIGMQAYTGMSAQFTDNPQGNWSRANWTMSGIPTYSVNASVSGENGSLSPANQMVNVNSDATINITPDAGYHIASITDNGLDMPLANPYIIPNVTANHTVVVTFSNVYTITATTGANGSVTPLGVVTVNPGQSQSFVIAAVVGYHIAEVLVDGVSVGAVDSYTFENVMAYHTIVASFAQNASLVEILTSIAEGTDDGYSTSGAGDFNNDTTWYEAGSPVTGANNNVWFRFTGITIPADAIIDEAYLETIQSKWDDGTSLSIFAEAAENPLAPTSTDDHASRIRTSIGVPWTSGYSDTTWRTSPNFAAVIQELMNSYNYTDGAIQILVDNNGSADGTGAAGYTFENTGFAPRLYIRYHLEPTVTTGAATAVTTASATLSGNLTSLGSDGSVAVSFEYGTTTGYGNTVAGTPATLTNVGTFTGNLTGLTAGTTYYYRAKAVGTLTVYGAQATFTTLFAAPPPPPPPPPPAPVQAPVLNVSGMSGTAPVIDTQGVTTSDSVLRSIDEQASIFIPTGTKMLGANGFVLNALTCAEMTTPPEPPPDNVVVIGYDFGPDGATFDPAITITINVNEEDLPDGAELADLKLAFWDGTAWQILESTQVDTATGQISAQVSHFTNFAVLSEIPPTPAPTVPPVTTTTVPPATPTTAVPEPEPVQPTVAPTSIEPAPVAPSADVPIVQPTQDTPADTTPPAKTSYLWLILAVAAFVIIGSILTVVIVRNRRRV